MKKYKTFKVLLVLILITIVLGFFFINSIIGKNNFVYLKSLFNVEQKYLIKKYIFPYKLISMQQKKILQNLDPLDVELKFKKSEGKITIIENNSKLSNDITINKYNLEQGFYFGINKTIPGSGFIDFFENNLFILSARGILAYTKNLSNDKKYFKQIKNNLNDFIDLEQFKKHKWFSFKDILIFKNKVFVSYTEEIEEDCWNTSIIYGSIDYDNIIFKKLFSPKKCVHSIKNVDKEFNAHQSGGRIISFKDNYILLSLGDYRSRHLAQNKESVNGKIIKININNSDYEMISMGHRNPQGLYFDNENNFILETEHGPQGGDEINLIEIEKIDQDKPLNYGWAIVSAGEHYSGKSESNIKKYEKYPLYKSHSKYDFVEPLKSFVPSIGISEIVKIGKNKYVVSSLKDKSLLFFELNEEKEIININKIDVYERVRDLKFNNNKLYLFLEDTASIGIINLN